MEAKNQPLFVEFYNLHLDCCLTIVPLNEIDTNEFKYRIETPEDEREEIKTLIRPIYGKVPSLQYTRKDKHWVKRGNKFVLTRQESIDEEDISYPVFPEQKWAGKLAIVAIKLPSAETKVKITEFFQQFGGSGITVGFMLEAYKGEHHIDWFESKDFLDFMFDYFCFKKLIDGYLEGKISTWTLRWLQEKIQNYRYSLLIYKDNEQVRTTTTTLGDEIAVDSFDFKNQGILIKGDFYGLELDFCFADIHFLIATTLEEKREIKRCAYNDCNNIFYANHQSRKYCFDKICQAKRSAESSKESDNRSRNRIRNIIVRAIDGWLEDKAQIRAAELMYEMPTIAKIMRHQKDPTKSLGTYLGGKLMEKLLRKKGIELTIKKEGNKNLYCFERIAIP